MKYSVLAACTIPHWPKAIRQKPPAAKSAAAVPNSARASRNTKMVVSVP